MDDNGQPEFFGPGHLPFKGLVLDGQRHFIPIQVESDFAHRHVTPTGVTKCTFDGRQFLFHRVRLDVAGVESHHTQAPVRPLVHHRMNAGNRGAIDVGQQ